MEVIRLNNLNQFIDLVNGLKGNWVFRGHSDSSWELETSIYRFFKHIQSFTRLHSPMKKIEAEKQSVQEFRRVSHLYINNLPKIDNYLEWLSVMQHYGTPTRLLDVTRSPYIALFFALDEGNQDAAVFFIKPECFSDIDNFSLNNAQIINDYLYNYQESGKSMITLFSPDWSTERIVIQQGLFLVPNSLDKSMNETIENYMPTSKEILKVIIPKNLRTPGVRFLIDMNLTSATLYPGFEGFCKSLRNQLFTIMINSTKLSRYKNVLQIPVDLIR